MRNITVGIVMMLTATALVGQAASTFRRESFRIGRSSMFSSRIRPRLR